MVKGEDMFCKDRHLRMARLSLLSMVCEPGILDDKYSLLSMGRNKSRNMKMGLGVRNKSRNVWELGPKRPTSKRTAPVQSQAPTDHDSGYRYNELLQLLAQLVQAGQGGDT